MKYYCVYGMNIYSEISLPEFAGAEIEPLEKPDVKIKYGNVPGQLENPGRSGICYQLGKLTLLLKIAGTAKYLATNGNSIIVDGCEGADERDICCFLGDAPLTAIMQQRGMLPIYGGAVQHKGRCVIISGLSGFGKSTVIYGLVKRGYKFLSDDLCAIDMLDGGLVVHPGAPCQKLQAHTLRENNLQPEDYQAVREVVDKYIVPLDSGKCVNFPLPPAKILFVCSWNKEYIGLSEIENENEKFSVLHDSMHRQYLVGMGSGFGQMKLAARIISEIPAFKVFRIQKKGMLNEMLDLIEKDFLK